MLVVGGGADAGSLRRDPRWLLVDSLVLAEAAAAQGAPDLNYADGVVSREQGCGVGNVLTPAAEPARLS